MQLLRSSGKDVFGIVGFGQSLSVGSNGFAGNVIHQLSARYRRPGVPDHCYMPKVNASLVPSGESDVRCGTNRQNPSQPIEEQALQASWVTGFTPTRAQQFTTSTHAQTIMESVGSRTLEYLRASIGARARVHVCTLGVGGVQIKFLRKAPVETQANGHIPYDDIITAVTQNVFYARKQGWNYKVRTGILRHGEANGNIPGYAAELSALISELNADIMAITGQTEEPVWVGGMYSSFRDTSWNSIRGLLEAHEAGYFRLTTPDYWQAGIGGFALDNQHHSGEGYTWDGEIDASVIDRIVIQGDTSYDPIVRPILVSRSGADITITFNVPVGALALATPTNVTDPGNYGFTYTDDSSPPAVSSVNLLGSNQVVVSLASTPTGANKKIRYAWGGYTTAFGATNPDGYVASEMARGCLRDSATRTAYDGTPLYNWCVHFEKDVA